MQINIVNHGNSLHAVAAALVVVASLDFLGLFLSFACFPHHAHVLGLRDGLVCHITSCATSASTAEGSVRGHKVFEVHISSVDLGVDEGLLVAVKAVDKIIGVLRVEPNLCRYTLVHHRWLDVKDQGRILFLVYNVAASAAISALQLVHAHNYAIHHFWDVDGQLEGHRGEPVEGLQRELEQVRNRWDSIRKLAQHRVRVENVFLREGWADKLALVVGRVHHDSMSIGLIIKAITLNEDVRSSSKRCFADAITRFITKF